MGNPSVRVVKNETFIKNLGNNEASYAEKKVNLALVFISLNIIRSKQRNQRRNK